MPGTFAPRHTAAGALEWSTWRAQESEDRLRRGSGAGGMTAGVCDVATGPDPLSSELEAIRDELEALAQAEDEKIELVDPSHRLDAVNLCHYLALRRHDVRALQRQLSERGLSSLGRCEPHVMATLLAVSAAARGRRPELPPDVPDFRAGRAALDANADALFGPRPEGRVPRIMVTLPTEAADDYELVRCLVSRGMDVARINGAHDGPARWEKMADNVEKAVAETRRSLAIAMLDDILTRMAGHQRKKMPILRPLRSWM